MVFFIYFRCEPATSLTGLEQLTSSLKIVPNTSDYNSAIAKEKPSSSNLSRMPITNHGDPYPTSSIYAQCHTPETKRSSRFPQKPSFVQKKPKLTRRQLNASIDNLLEDAVSPCRDSPPASRIVAALSKSEQLQPVEYYRPRRKRLFGEPMSAEETRKRQRMLARCWEM